MNMLSVVSAVLLIAISNAETECACTATASFDGQYGVTGTVIINQRGEVSITLNTAGVNASICGDGGSEFKYHIHEEWNYDDFDNRFGPTDCGSAYTAGHYNPYDKPVCSAVNQIDYWSCEVGDLSGRFGNLVPLAEDMVFTQGVVAAPCKDCKARLNPESVAGKSVVFHCTDGPRLFCSGFKLPSFPLETTTTSSPIASTTTTTTAT